MKTISGRWTDSPILSAMASVKADLVRFGIGRLRR